MKTAGMVCLSAFATAATLVLSIPQAQAANIIQFGDNATACGGSVLCSTDGTTGYVGAGGQAFDLSTINKWFEIGTAAQPMTAGQFLVVNDTGSILTSFSLTLTDNFNASTPSVTVCTGMQAGKECDDFQAHGGAKYHPDTMVSGADFDSCTQGTQSGKGCVGGAGGAAGKFAPNQVTYSWTNMSVMPGDKFDITFSSWNNGVYVPQQVPEPGSLALLVGGLTGLGAMRRRRKSKTA